MEARSLIFLLTAWLMFENGGAATTTLSLSSRLIHRFSDEVKSLRNGSVGWSSWPERKRSIQYYQMLLSSDLRRQNMKLGAHYQLLFPSQGSKTMSFGNDFGWFALIASFVYKLRCLLSIFLFFLNSLFDSVGFKPSFPLKTNFKKISNKI